MGLCRETKKKRGGYGMNELELAQHTADVTRWVAYVGFSLWGIAGWVVGRWFLKKNYIKPKGLINMEVVRQIENDNFEKNGEIKELKGQIAHFEAEVTLLTNHNKRLWAWQFSPHRDAHFITIKQVDKEGDEVALSQIHLPEIEHWVEPMAYADDHYESYNKWKESLPHNQDPETHTNFTS